MVKTVLQMLSRLVRSLAGVFAVGTVALLGYCSVRLTFVPRPERHCTMMTNGFTDAWGLTYLGRGGTVLALVELVMLVGALWASRTRARALRSLGHLVLILWAGLWMANAFYVFADGEFGLIYLMPLLFLCTCLRAGQDLITPSTPAPTEKLA